MGQYLSLLWIWTKSAEVNFFDLSRDPPNPPGQIEQKLAIFKTCSDSFNMGVIRSVLMPVVTLTSFKMIGCLEVPKLGRGPQILRSMYLCVKWNHVSDRIFSAGNRFHRFLPCQISSMGQYLSLLWIWTKSVESQFFDLSRDPLTSRPDRAKISHFQNLFRFLQYGCHSFSIDAQ